MDHPGSFYEFSYILSNKYNDIIKFVIFFLFLLLMTSYNWRTIKIILLSCENDVLSIIYTNSKNYKICCVCNIF